MRRAAPACSAGFSMIEMLIVLGIVGVLAVVGAPSLSDFVIGTRVKGAASDIYSSLVLARSEAIKRGTNVDIAPLTGGWVNGWEVKVGATVLRSGDPLSKLKIECPAGTNCTQTVTYRRDGRLSTGTITFAVDVTSPPSPRRISMRCVVVGVSGQINVQTDNNLDGNCANG
jgi:type IV fimbrial biogenesis protein FimT